MLTRPHWLGARRESRSGETPDSGIGGPFSRPHSLRWPRRALGQVGRALRDRPATGPGGPAPPRLNDVRRWHANMLTGAIELSGGSRSPIGHCRRLVGSAMRASSMWSATGERCALCAYHLGGTVRAVAVPVKVGRRITIIRTPVFVDDDRMQAAVTTSPRHMSQLSGSLDPSVSSRIGESCPAERGHICAYGVDPDKGQALLPLRDLEVVPSDQLLRRHDNPTPVVATRSCLVESRLGRFSVSRRVFCAHLHAHRLQVRVGIFVGS